MEDKLKELEKRIGYKFQDFSLLKHALMHSSYTNEKHLPKYQCNERLEFLGDAVLELVSSEFLLSHRWHFVQEILNLEVISCLEKEKKRQAAEHANLLLQMQWKH